MKYLLLLLLFPFASFGQTNVDTLVRYNQLQGIKVQTTGTDADGNVVSVPVTSTIAATQVPLAANGVWSSGWLDRKSYIAAVTLTYSDAAGSYIIDYSEDSTFTLSMPSVPITYSPLIDRTRPGAFGINAKYVRFTYTNGPVAQTKFKFDIRYLTTAAQPSMEGLGTTAADGRLAQIVKGTIETKDGLNGLYDKIYRHNNSLMVHQDTAIQVFMAGAISTTPTGTQNVAVTNFPSTQAVTVSGSVTTTPNGTQAVSVSNFPSSQAVSVSNFPTTQPVSGTVTVANPVSAVSVSNLPDSGQSRVLVKTVVQNFPTNQVVSGTVSISGTPTVTVSNPTTSVSVSNFPATQPVSIATTVPVSGTFWQATQPVSGPITDVQLRASALPVSGPFYQATQPVSAATLPLPSGAATSANQTTNNTSIASVDGKLTTTANGLKIDGSAVIQPVSLATAPLPTGAATATNQATEISSLGTLVTNTAGLATATNQATANSSLATIASNTTGAATATLQTAGNASLATLATNNTAGTSATITSLTLVATTAQSVATSTGAKKRIIYVTGIATNVAIGGSTASATNYSFTLAPGYYYELDFTNAPLALSFYSAGAAGVKVTTTN